MTHCFECGAFLAGSWTVHEDWCSFKALTVDACPDDLRKEFKKRNARRHETHNPDVSVRVPDGTDHKRGNG